MVLGETCLDIGPLDESRLSRWQLRLDCTQVLILIWSTVNEPCPRGAHSPAPISLFNTSFNPYQPFKQHPWWADPLPFLWDPRWGPGLAGDRYFFDRTLKSTITRCPWAGVEMKTRFRSPLSAGFKPVLLVLVVTKIVLVMARIKVLVMVVLIFGNLSHLTQESRQQHSWPFSWRGEDFSNPVTKTFYLI